ncbi:hypothetical protein [Microcoleus sp. herbarium14]|uniref:hypothetical protein n=1 Tax=Microcoleus sp. herbarium14 TaxID=3055439 RepID=UPI002FD751ED
MSESESVSILAESIKVFGWQQIRIPTKKLNQQMLSSEGYIALASCHLLHENTHQVSSMTRLVRFDKKFVQQALITCCGTLLLECLQGESPTHDLETVGDLFAQAITVFDKTFGEDFADGGSNAKLSDLLKKFRSNL